MGLWEETLGTGLHGDRVLSYTAEACHAYRGNQLHCGLWKQGVLQECDVVRSKAKEVNLSLPHILCDYTVAVSAASHLFPT